MALSPQSAPSAIAEDFVGLLKAYFRDFGKGKAL